MKVLIQKQCVKAPIHGQATLPYVIELWIIERSCANNNEKVKQMLFLPGTVLKTRNRP